MTHSLPLTLPMPLSAVYTKVIRTTYCITILIGKVNEKLISALLVDSTCIYL